MAQTAVEGAGTGVWSPERRRLTTGLVLTITLVAFEALSVATVMPRVRHDLGDVRLYGWTFSAFFLTCLVGIAVAGGLADRVPLRGPLIGGLLLFAGGLVVGGAAPDMPVLVAGRAIQGFGAGAVPAAAYVAIGRVYPDHARPRMFAVLSTAWVVPGLVGPAIAAVIGSTVGWRWVFFGLLPLVGVAVALAGPGLAVVPDPEEAPADRIALAPAVVTATGAGVVLAGLSSASVVLGVCGTAIGLTLVVVGLRRLTPPGTLRAVSGLPATVLSRGTLTFCFFAGDAYVPLAISTVRHAGLGLAGAALTASTLGWTAGSWVNDRRLRLWGPRRMIRGGELLILAGLGWMALELLPAVPVVLAVAAWGVAGLGMGSAYSPHSVALLDQVDTAGQGRATAGLQLTDVLGQALGTGAAGALVAAGGATGVRSGVAAAFGLAAAMTLVALVVGRRVPARMVGRSV